MKAPEYRHRQRWSQDDGYADVAENRSAFKEYSPLVFGGLMLVAAFAFAGHQIGRNASAHTAGVVEASLAAPGLGQTTTLSKQTSLLPEDETFQQMNLKLLRRQTVMADGKGDLMILDAGATDQNGAPLVDKARKRALAAAAQDAEELIKIEPASYGAKDAANEALSDAGKVAKKLALAAKPVEAKKKLKLASAEKKKTMAQRRLLAAEENCLARAIYFEARSESEMGQLAVAKVILNRTKSPDYPKTICGVVYQGSSRRNSCQFSFACDGLPDDVKSATSWARAKRLAQKAINGEAKMGSAMASATNYHADYVKPKWAKKLRKLVKIGNHIFYTGG